MKVAVSCDTAALDLGDTVCRWLEENHYEVVRVGCTREQRVEYPEAAQAGCAEVTSGRCERAILICGTGVGMSITANKVRGIRACCCSDYYSAKYTRLHNDANVLCFGQRVVGWGLANELVNVFLTTDFEGGRHAPRVQRMMEVEAGQPRG